MSRNSGWPGIHSIAGDDLKLLPLPPLLGLRLCATVSCLFGVWNPTWPPYCPCQVVTDQFSNHVTSMQPVTELPPFSLDVVS